MPQKRLDKMSKPPDAMNIQLSSMLMWVLPVVLGVALFGAIPTWMLDGWEGVAAETLAVAAVLTVMIASGSLSVGAAKKGATAAATVFMGCSLVRMMLCPLLVGLAWWISQLPAKPMGVWMAITYLLSLTLEAAWMVRALRNVKQQKAKKETQRDVAFSIFENDK